MALLQGNQGQTGKQLGQNLTASFGEYSDLLVSELQARYYENVYRGAVFSTANSGAQALSVASATFTGLAVANPAGSGKNLVLLDASFGVAAVITAACSVVLAYAPIVALTAGTAVGPNCMLVGGGVASVAKVGASAALGAAPTVLRVLSGTGWVTATAQGQFSIKDEIAGAIIIAPGQLLCIEALVAAVTVAASMTWAEVPI